LTKLRFPLIQYGFGFGRAWGVRSAELEG